MELLEYSDRNTKYSCVYNSLEELSLANAADK